MDICPHCGCEYLTEIEGEYVFAFGPYTRCDECGHEWYESDYDERESEDRD